MILVPSNLYCYKLVRFLYSLQSKENGSYKEAELLHRIVCADLVEGAHKDKEFIHRFHISEEEKEMLKAGNYINSDNFEIKARSLDLVRKNSVQFKDMTISASNAYLVWCEQEFSWEAFLRSLTIWGTMSISDDFMRRFFSIMEKNTVYGHIIIRIIDYLNQANTSFSWKAILTTYVEKRMKEEFNNDNSRPYRQYLISLLKLEKITKEECAEKTALAYEKEADNVIKKNKDKNTFVMGLDMTYKDGLKTIEPYKDTYPDIYNRLSEKLRLRQKDTIKIMPKLEFQLISDEYQEYIREWIEEVEIENFSDIIRLYLRIWMYKDICLREIIKHEEESSNKYFYKKHLGTTKLDNEGNTLGIENPKDSAKLRIYSLHRSYMEIIIAVAISHANNSNLQIGREDVAKLLKSCWNKYLDDKRFGLIVEGLYYGFIGDFIVASHLLIPQLEHFLHDLDEKVNKIDLTKLTANKQEECILNKIINDLYDINKPLFEELNFFLWKGSDVNFRNRLVHGLMEVDEMYKHGPYLWWLCLCLFLNTNELLKLKNKE